MKPIFIVCFITNNVPRLRAFCEAVFGGKAEGDDIHSELALDGFACTYVKVGGANNVVVGFNVDDMDAEYNRLFR